MHSFLAGLVIDSDSWRLSIRSDLLGLEEPLDVLNSSKLSLFLYMKTESSKDPLHSSTKLVIFVCLCICSKICFVCLGVFCDLEFGVCFC